MITRFWKWICENKTRTVISVFCFSVIIAFIVAVLIISNNGGVVPPELIVCTFLTFLTPIVMSALITIKDIDIKRIKIGELEIERGDSDEH